MADGGDLTAEDLRNFIIERGGKVTNHELVKHFKKFLNSDRQAEARSKFKDLVNTVATIKQEDGVKYLLLKKSANDLSKSESSNSISSTSVSSEHSSQQSDQNEAKTNENANSGDSLPTIVYSHSSPCISSTTEFVTPRKGSVSKSSTPMSSVSGPWSPDLPPGHTPQPPPRRKNSAKGKENRGTKFEENLKILTEEKENQGSPRREEIKDMVSPGNVKEKTQKLNKMASELEVPDKCRNGVTNSSGRRREHRGEKGSYEDDSCSVSTLDPRRKEWVIKASKSDYHELLRLLREEPKLANCKDLNSYTALHWAAKHGNLDVIKLIAGTHKADANARTSGGYTPLHLAAMFGREEIMEVLINTYGADPMLRDYSGKRPIQYLPKPQAERFASVFPEIVANGRIPGLRPSEKELQFHRIGSLNSKVKKTSVMLAGGKALTRMKSWGSADNIQQDRNLMPPPKFFPKKKKSRRQLDYSGTPEGNKSRSGDSDSDSASATTPGMTVE